MRNYIIIDTINIIAIKESSDHMIININEPEQTISKKAITVWRIKDFFQNGITLLVLCSLLFLYYKFSWFFWVGLIIYVMIAFVFLMMIYDLSIRPIYLQRTWRYDINKHVIQLKYGFFHRHHVIIPMSRIEYVNTHDGPLLRRYGLSSITIGTITSQHDIPALKQKEAQSLRNQIITLAEIIADEQIEDSNDEENDQQEFIKRSQIDENDKNGG